MIMNTTDEYETPLKKDWGNMNTLIDPEKNFWLQLYIVLNMDSFARVSWNFRTKDQTEQAADENGPTKLMDKTT